MPHAVRCLNKCLIKWLTTHPDSLFCTLFQCQLGSFFLKNSLGIPRVTNCGKPNMIPTSSFVLTNFTSLPHVRIFLTIQNTYPIHTCDHRSVWPLVLRHNTPDKIRYIAIGFIQNVKRKDMKREDQTQPPRYSTEKICSLVYLNYPRTTIYLNS